MPRTSHGLNLFQRQGFSPIPPQPGEGHPHRLMLVGGLFVVLGLLGLAMALLVTFATTLAFGILFVMGGVAQTVHAFSVSGWTDRGGYLAMGILYLGAGFLILFNPLAASAVFTLFLAAAFVVLGVCRIGFAVRNRAHRRWLWPLVAGNLSILLGIVMMLQWPLTGLWAIALLVSLEMIFHGWGFVALPLFDRKRARTG